MKDFIQPILDLIKSLIQPQQGTKFLVTVACVGAIYMLVSKSAGLALDTELLKYAVVMLGLMPIAYYVADFLHKNRGQKPPEEGEVK